MPIREYRCLECDNIDERLELDGEKSNPLCSKCNGKTERIVSLCGFKLEYDPKKDSCSWGNEGYASSHYWDAVKKQREEGKDVKPVIDGDKY